MTMSDLFVEGPGPPRVHPTTSSTQPVSRMPTDTGGAAVGVWTRSSRPPPGLSDKPSSVRATGTSRRAARQRADTLRVRAANRLAAGDRRAPTPRR